MQSNKVKSFTLSELLVVMIITIIVVGITFSVLNLVQKQIRIISKNFQKTTELSLFEQRLWQDFNYHSTAVYSGSKLTFISDIDTVTYSFNEEFAMRNKDTIPLRLTIEKAFYFGREIRSGYIDAVSVSGQEELPNYSIFASGEKDATHFMNQDGF